MSNLKPRGFYLQDTKWSKDKDVAYFQGTNLKVVWPCVKIFSLLAIFAMLKIALGLSTLHSVGICFCIIMFYQDVVCLILPNTIKMPAMDQQCFLSSTKAHVNYMNVSVQDKSTKQAAFDKWSSCIDTYPKMSYKVKEICGDYYYEKMSKEETIKKAMIYAKDKKHELKCQKDIDGYVRDNMNTKV
jgi:hypothetical protein